MSLNHFSIDLQVSKNTVIHDINHVKEQLEDHGLSLKYSRKHGYEIVGDEFEVRRFFIKLIDQRLNHDITKSEVLKALNNIQKISHIKRQDQTGRTIFEESLYRQITEFIALRPLCDS